MKICLLIFIKLKKGQESQRQRAHPENAPQCHICGRICSTTWNLKQHIEKHYDIHPQKGVLKKKLDESPGRNNSLSDSNRFSNNSLSIVTLNDDSSNRENATSLNISSTTSSGFGLSSMIMPGLQPVCETVHDVNDTEANVKQEKEDEDSLPSGKYVHCIN